MQSLLLLLLLLGIPLSVLGQSVPPMQRWAGVGDEEFLMGAYESTRSGSDRIADLWEFMGQFGITTLIRTGHDAPRRVDSLMWAATANQRLITDNETIFRVGWGRSLEFYLFDSTQSPFNQWKFASRSGGISDTNQIEKNQDKSAAWERIYSIADSTTVNQVIAEKVCFDWSSKQVYRWPRGVDDDDSLQHSEQFLSYERYGKSDTTLYLAVIGHLFGVTAAPNTTQLFKIEVFHEIAKGVKYFLPNNTTEQVAGVDTLQRDTVLYVTKGDFTPLPNETYNKYQEVVFPLHLRYVENGARGPLHTASASKRIDVRVTWLGGERVALRAIALRDGDGQRLSGRDATSRTFRAGLFDDIRRFLYGPSLNPDSLRRNIIAIYSGEEPYSQEVTGYALFDRMLRDTFNVVNSTNANLRDSLPLFSAQSGVTYPQFDHSIIRAPFIVRESYMNGVADVKDKDQYNQQIPTLFGVPYRHTPSIAEQNGGRFHVPLLRLTPDDVEDYTTTMQRWLFGAHMPNLDIKRNWFQQNTMIYDLGQCALTSRQTGRRLIQVPSMNMDIVFRPDTNQQTQAIFLDTLISHVPSEAEVRCIVNLGLAYGSRGVAWWWLGGYQNFINTYHLQPSGDTLWYGTVGGGFGPVGPLTSDTAQDHVSQFHFRGSDNPDSRVMIPNFFAGRGTRTRALRKIQGWLGSVGPELAKLRWRESYSLHFSAARANTVDTNFGTRPLPSSEIITEVKSYKINDTIPDAPEATYVELGFFDKKTGTTNGQADSKKDTNYVFVVNRRTFEPPDYGTTISQARRDSMVALAENRRIRLKLNLLRKDFQQYEFVQVREIAADTTRLVGDSVPRQALNVIVPADGAIEIALRPGSGSLLEIVYKQPDESVIAGKLETNNQHKMVYVDGRYYCVYTKDTARARPNCDLPKQYTSSFVFLRRSLPVDTTGVILWEPMEDWVDYDDPCDFLLDNRHPALTVRRTGINGVFTAITITWTAHVRDTSFGDTMHRAVYARDIGISTLGSRFFGNIERVAYYVASDPNKLACRDVRNVWGTPVVCRTSKGYTFAYSCANAGIVARVRQYTPGSSWPVTGAYSGYDSISLYNGDNSSYGRGLYPSVPAFAHEGLGDSSCGIVWQQPERRRLPGPGFSIDFDLLSGDTIRLAYQIRYARLKQLPGAGGVPALSQSYRNFRFANNANGPVALAGIDPGFNDYRNPCMDQTQDIYGRIQEMVTYQSLEPSVGNGETEPLLDLVYLLRMRSVYTDPQAQSWLWGDFAQRIKNLPWNSRPADWVYQHRLNATVGSLNDMTAAVSTSPVAFFSIAYNSPNGSSMRQTTARYTEPLDSARKKDAKYTYGGTYPQASCAPQHQATREAVLYQGTASSTPALRITRQFFARTRPVGYLAHGRSLAFSVDDSSQTAFHTSLFDLWYATDSVAVPLPLAALPNYQHMELDSLAQAPLLFRTPTFEAHDSVQIGFSLSGMFGGVMDTANAAQVHLWLDLMNATTDTVVTVLDSAWITMSAPDHGVSAWPVLDLLSGSYYIRLRLDTVNIPAVVWNPNGSPKYPVVDLHGWMGDDAGGLSKLRREGNSTASQARIAAQPNPFTGTTELRFSIPSAGDVGIRVFDPIGRPVAEVLPQQWMEVGRYALGFDASQLPPGTYMMELMIGQQRVVEKMVVVK